MGTDAEKSKGATPSSPVQRKDEAFLELFYLAENIATGYSSDLSSTATTKSLQRHNLSISTKIIYTEILPRLDATTFLSEPPTGTHQTRISAYMKEGYARICREKRQDNPAFYEALIPKTIYKRTGRRNGISVSKVKMEKAYRLFNR